jgi:uncharacterized protein with ParB-like and HNH nuclease domain
MTLLTPPPRYTRYRDIPPFTRHSSYQVNVGWDYLETQLASFAEWPGLMLDPDFQRAHVWTEMQQIRYIEFRLRGGRSASNIYWNSPGWQGGGEVGPLELVDGKQRLEAVRRFMRDEIPAFGSLRSEYTDRLRIVQMDLVFNINDLETRAEVLQWYISMNAGGIAHTDEEIEKVRKLLVAEQENRL